MGRVGKVERLVERLSEVEAQVDEGPWFCLRE